LAGEKPCHSPESGELAARQLVRLPNDFEESCGGWAMGDDGSGQRWISKPTTGQALRLDVRWLAHEGLIRSGIAASMSLNWTRNGKPAGDITVRYDAARPHELILDYRTVKTGEIEWTDVREVIPLEWTPCHYGGERVWCRCPGCGSRRAVLYSRHGRFLCVPCNRLAYAVTREDRLTQLNRRGEKIADRLGAEREWVLNWLIPPFKPKGMHWRTYERLCREWRAVRDAANADYYAGLLRLIASSERMLRQRRLG
jgi:hypothetical protein